MKKSKAKRQDRPRQPRGEQPERAAWQPPTITAVGTIAELVQQVKVSGNQDAGGRRRHGP
jgi:hypothetical protein